MSSPGCRRTRLGRDGLPGGRDAGLLLAARVLMSAERALVGVVVPIYLARRGFSATELGILFSIVALTSATMSTLIGVFADRVGRKPFLIYIPLLTAAAAAVFAATDVTWALFAAASLGSFGRGSGAGGGMVGPYQPAEQALLAGLVDDRRRNTLFGLVASASAAGGLLGSILAATPLSAPAAGGAVAATTYRPAFLAAAALAVLTAVCALPVHAPRTEGPPAPLPSGSRRRRQPLSAEGRRLVYRLWATNAVNGAAVGLFAPFLTYWLYRRYGVSAAQIGILYTIVNVVTIVTNQFAAPLARRRGTVRMVVITRTLQALLLPALAVMPSFPLAGVVYGARLVVQRIGMSLRQSFVMGASPAQERARVAAFAQLPTQGISALAPTLSGYLLNEVSLALPFEIAGVLQLINAGLFHHFFGQTAPGPVPAARQTPPLAPGRPSYDE